MSQVSAPCRPQRIQSIGGFTILWLQHWDRQSPLGITKDGKRPGYLTLVLVCFSPSHMFTGFFQSLNVTLTAPVPCGTHSECPPGNLCVLLRHHTGPFSHSFEFRPPSFSVTHHSPYTVCERGLSGLGPRSICLCSSCPPRRFLLSNLPTLGDVGLFLYTSCSRKRESPRVVFNIQYVMGFFFSFCLGLNFFAVHISQNLLSHLF